MTKYINVDKLLAWIAANAEEGTLAPTKPDDPSVPTGGVTLGKAVVFSAPFTDSTNWTVGRTSAYPGTTNPTDNKLDRLSPTAKAPMAGRLTATKRSDGFWDCDFVTTEYSEKAFQAKAGDELSALVTLYQQQGAWPAIWTWKDGGSEVDAFEYHPDNPSLLEFTNHTDTRGPYFNYANQAVKPGAPFLLVCKFKTSGVEWWIDGVKVFTGTGVPANWSAYLIVNMSVSAGKYHPAPTGLSQLYCDVVSLRVWR